MILISLILWNAIFASDFGFMNIYSGTWKINCARLACAFLLHMKILPETRCALDMIHYAKNNSEKFYGKGMTFPFYIGMMKFWGGLLTEILNIFVIV
jgi:hypothetical protein